MSRSILLSILTVVALSCGKVSNETSSTKVTTQDGVTGTSIDLEPFINMKESCQRNDPPPGFEFVECGKTTVYPRVTQYRWVALPFASERDTYWAFRSRKDLILQNTVLRYIDIISSYEEVPKGTRNMSSIEMAAPFNPTPSEPAGTRIVNPTPMEVTVIVDHNTNRLFKWDVTFSSGNLASIKVVATSLTDPTQKAELFSEVSGAFSLVRNPTGVIRRLPGNYTTTGKVSVPFAAEVKFTIQMLRLPGLSIGQKPPSPVLNCGDDPSLRDDIRCGFNGSDGLMTLYSAKFFGSQCVPNLATGGCI